MREAKTNLTCDLCGKQELVPADDALSMLVNVRVHWPNRGCVITVDVCKECYPGDFQHSTAVKFLKRLWKKVTP